MLKFLLVCWFLFLLVFLYYSSNLLLSLLILEIMSFFLLFLYVMVYSSLVSLEFLLVSFFCLFVMEGVMALSGLIMLVSFTGSDYVSLSTLLKLS